MNLSTNYMGLELKNPLIAGASPLTTTAEKVSELEDPERKGCCLNSIPSKVLQNNQSNSLEILK